jgi:hypothetical protein
MSGGRLQDAAEVLVASGESEPWEQPVLGAVRPAAPARHHVRPSGTARPCGVLTHLPARPGTVLETP